ncbi:DEAD/DEAH box helicase [Salinispira pacifica]|uniref:Cold-shock DEAD-box protein A n=1 Tax=Salinispira pacifica TaxID=1307761 RepID=V5WJM0_9SPIO|nr:DEAD/DEAH box helicase [Salinispira pacifica]AHC15840.1 Cold-shock DEAD-box protein A [Salinispira pacifica]
MKKFTEYNLHPDLQTGIEAAGFTECTPVQEETFSAVFNGRDVTVKSQTGTGKTAAFLISIFQTLMESRQASQANGQEPEQEQVLILAPTRELVVQIYEEAQLLGAHLDFSFTTIYGGVGYNQQERELADNPDFIVGTPGRLLDFMQQKKIDFRRFAYLVIDEADRMFDMGFYPDIQKILRRMKSPQDRRTLLFSATLGTRVLNIAWEHMNDPVDIEIEPEHITVDAVKQTLYHVSRDEKMSLLLGLIRKHQPESAIFFTNTKRMAEELSFRLRANDFTAEFIMGDLPQKKRLQIINAVKNKQIRFLVATDVAARGLHIDDLAMVFNYDLPEDSENYVHRIGRTARAGNSGIAVSLADERSVYNLSSIEQYMGSKIPTEDITEDLIAEDRSRGTRFHSDYGRGSSRGGNRSGGRPSSRGGRSSSRNDSRRKPSGSQGKSSGGGSKHRSNQQSPAAPGAKSQHSETRNAPSPSKRGGKRKSQKPAHRGGKKPAQTAAPTAKMSEQERLDFYARKYGEDFAMKGKKSARKTQKKSQQKKKSRSTHDQREQSGSPAAASPGKQNQNRVQGSSNRNNQAQQKRKGQGSRSDSRKNKAAADASRKGSGGADSQSSSAAGKSSGKGKGIGGFLKKIIGRGE